MIPRLREFVKRQPNRSPETERESLPDPGIASLRNGLIAVILPMLVVMLATAWFRSTDADLAVCRQFYSHHGNEWPLGQHPLSQALYHYGPWPALAIGIGGLGIAILGLFLKQLQKYISGGLFLAGVLALGPGLIIFAVSKPAWNRPRPCLVREFGGRYDFVPVGDWGERQDSKSFPSGHAAMGFYLITPAFLLYRRRRRWAIGFLVLGLAYGMLIGGVRIAQGGHFPSDVLWSAAIIYFSAVFLHIAWQCIARHLGERLSNERSAQALIFVLLNCFPRSPQGESRRSRQEPRSVRREAI